MSDPPAAFSAEDLLLTLSHWTLLSLPFPFPFSFCPFAFPCSLFSLFLPILFEEPPDLPLSLSFLSASTVCCLLQCFCSLPLLHAPSLCSQDSLPVLHVLLRFPPVSTEAQSKICWILLCVLQPPERLLETVVTASSHSYNHTGKIAPALYSRGPIYRTKHLSPLCEQSFWCNSNKTLPDSTPTSSNLSTLTWFVFSFLIGILVRGVLWVVTFDGGECSYETHLSPWSFFFFF